MKSRLPRDEVDMKVDSGEAAYPSWTWLWKRCLGIAIAIVVLFISMMAGTMISAIFFPAAEL